MSEIPTVNVLEAINPANSGTGAEVLAYNGLGAAVEKYRPANGERWSAVWDAEQGSLEEVSAARQLAAEYLLRTSEKVVNSHEGNRDVWAERFTLAATELYGAPETAEVTRLITEEYTSLVGLQGNAGVSQPHVRLLLDTYRPVVENGPGPVSIDEAGAADTDRTRTAVRAYGEAMREQYQPLFDLVDQAAVAEFTPSDLHVLFTQAMSWLEEHDDQDWGAWKVQLKDSTQLSVDAGSHSISIASRRESASPEDAKGLIAHELLVHALRGKNGYKTGDKKLATGLPGYLDAEEGLGILAEEAINGTLPDKAYDRYVDIALALGTADGVQRTRQELFQISYARQLVRAQLRGADEGRIATLAPRVWSHVDRIYRGGPGDGAGTRQAIFTKDITYYEGYRRMAGYVAEQLVQGKPARAVFAYLSQGKFDPTNAAHRRRIAEARQL